MSQAYHLDVEVCKAESLARSTFFASAADTYVKVFLDNKIQRQTTSTKRSTQFPIWQETLRFRNVRLDQTLFLKVYALRAMSRDRFLGVITLPIRSYFDDQQIGVVRAFRKTLRSRTTHIDTVSGSLTFKLRFRHLRGDHQPLGATAGRRLVNAGLPDGWELRHDDRGRIFFHQPSTARMQWEHPSMSTSSRSSASSRRTAMLPPTPRLLAHSHVSSPAILEESLPSLWELRFTDGGRPYFVNHGTRTTHWEDPRTDAGALAIGRTLNASEGDGEAGQTQLPDDAPAYARSFACKLASFRSGCVRAPEATKWELKIRRRHVLEDSYRLLCEAPPAHLKRPLFIRFEGEEALDYGGVAREWLCELSHAIFNPAYGLFEYSALDNYSLQISANSDVHNDYIKYFRFIGRVAGMAVFNSKYLAAFWVPAIYKRLLDAPVDLTDLANIDPERYQSLCWMRDNSINDVLFETFTVSYEKFGDLKTDELIEGGSLIEVTDDNKLEYIARYIEWRTIKHTEQQLNALVEGFHEVIPREQLAIFDHKELELLIGGIAEINADDWMKNTSYKTYSDASPTIEYFWRFVREANQETRAKLLQFVTGTSRLPTTGFRDLYGSDGPRRFCIEQFGSTASLPRSHTCFNRLDLPPYGSYELLHRKLTAALEFNGNHFGLE